MSAYFVCTVQAPLSFIYRFNSISECFCVPITTVCILLYCFRYLYLSESRICTPSTMRAASKQTSLYCITVYGLNARFYIIKTVQDNVNGKCITTVLFFYNYSIKTIMAPAALYYTRVQFLLLVFTFTGVGTKTHP